jgi:hypothetical protein
MAKMGIKAAIQLEAWNITNTNRLSATQSIQCMLSKCEVNNTVFLGCITKMENSNNEQCYAIKTCIKLHKRTMEEYES